MLHANDGSGAAMTGTVELELDQETLVRIKERALFVREETVRLIEIAKTGHYASSFSAAEIVATLYYGVMRLRRGEPDWPDRDRFLLGKGHAAVGLYPVLADWGFLAKDVLDAYTRLGNPLGDHPDMRIVPGIDFTSGSLGHALSAGYGMALAGRLQGQRFNVFVLLGDGELHEGQVWEAAMAAAHNCTDRLVAIIDRNGHSLDGDVDDVIGLEPLAERWRAFGWECHEVDGHDVATLYRTLAGLAADTHRTRPAAVIAKTMKGKGVEFMEKNFGWHIGYLGEEDRASALAELQGRS
jgi:transketolase